MYKMYVCLDLIKIQIVIFVNVMCTLNMSPGVLEKKIIHIYCATCNAPQCLHAWQNNWGDWQRCLSSHVCFWLHAVKIQAEILYWGILILHVAYSILEWKFIKCLLKFINVNFLALTTICWHFQSANASEMADN